MPVPHFNIKITQRSKGNSAVAGAAYQAGEKLFSEYDQKTKNYTCKKEVVYTEIMLPPNAPPEYADRAQRSPDGAVTADGQRILRGTVCFKGNVL